MPTRPQTQSAHSVDKQVFNLFGVLLQFLASPDDVGDAISLFRGTVPAGVVIPLHSHADPELLYILEGSLEVFQPNEGSNGWRTVGAGDVVVIPSNVKHALRNSSSLPVTIALVSRSGIYEFFRELAKPFDPSQHPIPPTPEEMQGLLIASAKYGYWLATAEENAAIGL